MQNSHYFMKERNILSRGILLNNFIILVLVFVCNLSLAQEKIEGFFYLDHSPISVEIMNGKILKITRLKDIPKDFPEVYIAPGFIDNQVNGYAGVSFSLGGGDLTFEGIQKATMALWKEGVTSYLPTLTTNDKSVLLKNLSLLNEAKDNPLLLGSIPGFHLEGPYISPEDGYRGAHPLQYVCKPDWNEFMEYCLASGGNILQITLAPEMEDALDFITKCRNENIVVALGHHNASSDIITKAVDQGAQISTHMGNGVANMINRHHNPFWPQLSDDRLMISIIGDGFHLLPEEIRTFYLVKGAEKTIITSDATSYATLPPGKYRTSEGDTLEITSEGMLRNLNQNGGLYGSASPITKGVGNVLKVTGCSLAEAFQMASSNPAHLYGLNDRGEIKTGLRADLVLFTLDRFTIKINKTIVAGHVVYTNQ